MGIDNQCSLWDQYARAYHMVLPEWKPYSTLAESISRHFKGLGSVIDIACGPGIMSNHISENCVKVIGVDSSQGMLEYARKNIKGNCEFRYGDFNNLAFPNEEFDGALLCNALYVAPDPYKVLVNSTNTLRRDGVFVVSGPVPNPDIEYLIENLYFEMRDKGLAESLKVEIDIVARLNREIKKSHIRNGYYSSQMLDLLSGIGLRTVLEARDDFYFGNCFMVACRK